MTKTIRVSVLLAFAMISCLHAWSQQLNSTDQRGLKQGPWKRLYPNGNVMYQGVFRDGHPVGEFKRFNEQGVLVSVMNFSEDGKTADAVIYYPDGKPSSKGKYLDQKKEGKWQFFSQDGGYLLSEEHYTAGMRNGLSVNFYPDSTVAEKVTYVNDVKNGEWTRYHPDGRMLLRSAYRDGRIHGKFEVWHDNGKLEFAGGYRYNMREGMWSVFNRDGSLRYKVEYANGVPDNNRMELEAARLIDSIEKNSIKIPDPEKPGAVW